MSDVSKGKPNVGVIIVVIISILIVSVITYFVLNYTHKMAKFKVDMERYLEEEYAEKFVVKGLSHEWTYLGGPWLVKGIAFPKANPSLEFEIVEGNIVKNRRTYAEVYQRILWEDQMNRKLKKIFKNAPIWTAIQAEYKIQELYGRKIGIHQAERILKNRIDLYINYGLFLSIDDYKQKYNEYEKLSDGKMSKELAEYLYKLIQKLRNYNYREINLFVRYFDKSYMKEVENNPEKYLTGQVSRFENLSEFKAGTVLCEFRIDNLNQIKRPEEISSFMNQKWLYIYKKKNQ